MWNPDTGADTKCPAMEPMCQIMFYNQLPTSDTFHNWTPTPKVGRFHIGDLGDVEPGHWDGYQCLAMEAMIQFMIYSQLPTSDTIHKLTLGPEVGRFHIGALTDVEPGHWGGHQVSSHGTDVSNHVLYSIANF